MVQGICSPGTGLGRMYANIRSEGTSNADAAEYRVQAALAQQIC